MPVPVSGRGADHVTVFDQERDRLRALAYRLTGTPDDADDVVQDAWLRWDLADREPIREPAAWLTTVTTRLALDRLRSARSRREVYVGTWLPEPLVAGADDEPFAAAAAAEGVSLAFLVAVEHLSPVERAVLVLHDALDVPFDQVAGVIDRSPAATRQIASRARRRVHDAGDEALLRAASPDDRRTAADLATAFLGAAVTGDVDGLRALLAPDVVHLSDGGAERRAARRRVLGPHRVGRLVTNLASRAEPGTDVAQVTVNGEPGFWITVDGQPEMLLVPVVRNGRIRAVLALLAPAKLDRVARALAR